MADAVLGDVEAAAEIGCLESVGLAACCGTCCSCCCGDGSASEAAEFGCLTCCIECLGCAACVRLCCESCCCCCPRPTKQEGYQTLSGAPPQQVMGGYAAGPEAGMYPQPGAMQQLYPPQQGYMVQPGMYQQQQQQQPMMYQQQQPMMYQQQQPMMYQDQQPMTYQEQRGYDQPTGGSGFAFAEFAEGALAGIVADEVAAEIF
mmetsp:Transcript_15106/g.32554  ORF Transcript_15106/g.32554 Transcript_15106/m.32554 type:complete len:203 (+) Transcript_15106:78-686(+)|eukprot:CAMPEP_0206480918 /NCGR_PEP_ID=MMETSP0324_2-20121206/37757_1 /ASSEMBLY_ACC=CAM_ASM_000836 /TAXON_ID=2866 /ORGANISM="Crypthecodinium cohnii, Strain Seligo" /LENGTH=202 /DNA_ID=CAMNT_0053958151 /DNA_START=13 /DNA_END=621 /DNA_ORIENTATION=+